MQWTLCQISGADGCHQQTTSCWDLQWTALPLASPLPDCETVCFRGVPLSLETDQGHKDLCAESRMLHSFSLLLCKRVLHRCCHMAMWSAMQRKWWSTCVEMWTFLLHCQTQVIQQKLSLILCYLRPMVVDYTINIISDNQHHWLLSSWWTCFRWGDPRWCHLVNCHFSLGSYVCTLVSSRAMMWCRNASLLLVYCTS